MSFSNVYQTISKHLCKKKKKKMRREKSVFVGIYGQRRPRSDCAIVQFDLGLRCPLTESSDAKEYVDIL